MARRKYKVTAILLLQLTTPFSLRNLNLSRNLQPSPNPAQSPLLSQLTPLQLPSTPRNPNPRPTNGKKFPNVPPHSHPLAPFIPAYARDVNGRLTVRINNKRRGMGGGTAPLTVYDYSSGQGYGTGGDREIGRKVVGSMNRRRELLEQATRMWQMRRKGNRGGEVAIWFAERVGVGQEFQELAQAESLNASRALVQGRRLSHNDGPSTIDLHGVTATEGVTMVRELLSEGSGIGGSMSNPLKIITGKGMHSVNQASVLQPAGKKVLVEDGWNVSGWEGGLVVRGRR